MEIFHDRVALTLTRKIHELATAFVIILGLVVLVGWGFNLDRLHTLSPRLGEVKPGTAITLLLAGLSLRLWKRSQDPRQKRAAKLCGAIVAINGLLAMGWHILGWNIDPRSEAVLASDILTFLLNPKYWMSLNTALSLFLVGCALFVLDIQTKEGRSPAEWLAMCSALVPFTALVGYIYGVPGLISPFTAPFSPATMALQAALGLLVLSIAVLTARPERGWMARFVSDGPEGIIARKLLPSGILILLGLGWLTETGERAGLYEHNEGAAILVSLGTVTLGILVRHSMNVLASIESDRRKAEISLRRSEEHLRMALEAACVGTWEWDITTNNVRWSESIESIFGLPKEVLEGDGDRFLNIIHPEDRELVISRAARAIQGSEPYRIEYRIIRPDKAISWVASRGEVFRDPNGRPLRIAGTTIDVTERRRLERELIETSNREQRRLGQDLHDDLGQWLTAIHLETRALTMRLQGKSEAEAAHAERIVSSIREALERTRMLARGMAPAVIESGGLAAALFELAASTERMFRVHCHCNCCDTLTVNNAEAALHLYRIAQEAISNAIRHGSATEIEVCLKPQENGRAYLAIRDNGSGISQPAPRGAGLGLHIMQYRAGLLGADIRFTRAETGGTEVICTFSQDL